ncbi:MAG: DUF4412 domain-containing protein [archaeon]|nr:DUF4412 domain-containing protein [Candidatus Micrarchaeota archaeon]
MPKAYNKKIILLCGLILVGLLLIGCAQSSPPNGGEAGEDIFQILAKGKAITDLYYETTSEISGGVIGSMSTEGKIWMKGKKMKIETTVEGPEQVIMTMIIHPGVAYVYNPDDDTYMEIMVTEEQMPETPGEQAESLKENFEIKIIGKETYKGKECTIVSLTPKQTEEPLPEDFEMKMWVWNENGLTLKVETGVMGMTSVMENKNFSFESIDESIFEVPPEKIVEQPAPPLPPGA